MSYYVHVYHEVYLPPMLPYSGKVSRDEMALFCESLNIRHSYLGIDDGNDGKVALFWINL